MSQDNKPRIIYIKRDDGFTQIWSEKSLNLLQDADSDLIKNSYIAVVEYSAYEAVQVENAKLKEQVKVMREALEFYADGSNWEHISPHKAEYRVIEESDMGDGNFQITQMTDDEWVGGKRARATLEKVGR